MYDLDKRLFVGVKISTKLQNELDHCARDTERYFKEDKVEYLQVVTLGEERLIGRFLQDGFPVNDIDNVSRNIRSIVQLVAPRYRVEDGSIQIYADCTVRSVRES
ncbi:MAG: hypothetical protein A2W73_06260 [Deltaproteobacteria bacterium RIFCSPLOWO2_12_55_13]|nr:MAG: hypothetical protein A2W73_06260 [Deltaproteobacteria bacterium RIFCSPLOWO2_12_55_13]OGQ96220.1 MAG: hypothetical protein A2253_09985 [Deltaproteobacteria bacterium RIFOXYA2_FULL_55_11]HBA40155.1 hypothetical protein [Deltaproteobacteria bacterium]